MDLELSEDQQHLADSVRAVLERESPLSLARSVAEGHKGAEDLWARMVSLDWQALAIPLEDGGLGMGTVELSVVCEQLGRVIAPGPFLATATQFVPAVLETGTPEQRRRFLEPVARGAVVGTLALSEADGSFAPGSIETTLTAKGRRFRLDGEKHFVMEAARSDEIVVAARVAGRDGSVVLAVVPTGATTVQPLDVLDATRSYSKVSFDAVEIEADRVLGDAGAAGYREAIERAIEVSTTALAAEMVGTCQGAFDVVHGYVLEREQFGVKIGSFQAIKHKLANMFVALESARVTAYFAAAAIDEDDERRPIATAMAKAAAGDCQKLLATEAIQCLGGIGYTWEHDAHLFVKRLKTSAALFGTAAAHRRRIAELIGL